MLDFTNNDTLRKYATHGVGLDRLIDDFSKRVSLNQPNYPPYNIVKVDDYKYLIELAVAGFSEDDLSIEFAEDTLKVSGNKEENTVEREYLHKGIGARFFNRTFALSPDVVVNSAALENGLLKILLERIVPEHKKPKSIKINGELKLESKVTDEKLLLEKEDTS